MATFSAFSNLLPDPAHPIGTAGDINASGTPGPGFASVTLTSTKATQLSRTISGRGVTRENGSHNWSIQIKYNPMLRYQFDPIDTFLLSRNARLTPFYVILPQYSQPVDLNFAGFVNATPMSTPVQVLAGANSMMLQAGGNVTGNPTPGDMFTLIDPLNYNHQKVYKIVRVETNSYYQAGSVQPSLAQKRIWFNPPLQRNISAGTVINFSPQFRVVSTQDDQSYDLSTDNLYSFSLSLEEIQP